MRPAGFFIGKKGQQVKTCYKCREKDARHKSKPEVREKRNAFQREKEYYKDWREKKRREDEEAYLAHNATIMRDWRSNNQEHLSAWQKNNVASRLRAIKGQAEVKGYEWALDDAGAKAMMTSVCHYCGQKDEERVLGIDRMDNSIGYVPSNCVPACKACNFMKKCLDVVTFVQRCKHISGVHDFLKAWPDSKCAAYSEYKNRADKKGLAFELTKDDYRKVCGGACLYCGKASSGAHTNGIDRVDNTKGYTVDNVVPCCSKCNYMKRDMTQEEFAAACAAVAETWRDKEPEEAGPRNMRSISKRHKRV